MNIFGDLEDLESALKDPEQKMPLKVQGKYFIKDCSVFLLLKSNQSVRFSCLCRELSRGYENKRKCFLIS